MFELAAAALIAMVISGVVIDDEFYRLLNTFANMGTLWLLIWHQRHVRKELEPKVDKVERIVTRKLGTRNPSPPQHWDGTERRK